MILIAHRGNIDGPNPNKENHPDYLQQAMDQGYHVELDVWWVDNKYVLGHDKPQYEVAFGYLINSKMWVHAKNIETFLKIVEPGFLVHTFLHETDPCVLTTNKYIWTFPGYSISDNRQIAVVPERVPGWDISRAGGVCSDYVLKYSKP